MSLAKALAALLVQPTAEPASSEAPLPRTPPPPLAVQSPTEDAPKSVDTVAVRSGFAARVSVEVTKAVRRRTTLCEGFAARTAPERRLAQQRNNDAAGANILEDGTGTSTSAERLAAAVGTGLDGVEAGATIAPLALVPSFAPKTPHGPSLLLAALADGKVRTGAGYSVTVRQPTDAGAVWLKNACGDEVKRTEAVTKAVETTLDAAVEDAYVSVCEALVPRLPSDDASSCGNDEFCQAARARSERIAGACHHDVNVRTLAGNARQLDEGPSTDAGLRRALRSVADQIETLQSAGESVVAISTGVDTESFLHSFRARQWTAVSVRLGLDGSADFARAQLGKRRVQATEAGQPGEPESLERGEVLAWRAGPSVLLKAGRAQLGLGVGGGQTIPVGAETMFTELQTSVSFSWLAGFLDDEKVDREDVDYLERVPKFDDEGGLPAHVVLGARASTTIPITKPAFQDGALSAATLLVHADFLITKTLKFRLGVPVTAELVEQAANVEAEPDIPKRTVLRWSVPVFGTTVLAF